MTATARIRSTAAAGGIALALAATGCGGSGSHPPTPAAIGQALHAAGFGVKVHRGVFDQPRSYTRPLDVHELGAIAVTCHAIHIQGHKVGGWGFVWVFDSAAAASRAERLLAVHGDKPLQTGPALYWAMCAPVSLGRFETTVRATSG